MRFLHGGLFAIAILAAPHAQATIIGINFDDLPTRSVVSANLELQGFRFSPNCHYDLTTGPNGSGGFAETNWLGFDGAGCTNDLGYIGINPDYVGPTDPSGPKLFVDRYGGLFSFLGLYQAQVNWQLYSSKGGFFRAFTGPFDPPMITFNGDVWTDIEWLLFHAPGTGAPVGFDNLILQVPVPEPGTTTLLVTGLLIAAVARRKMQRPISP